MIIAVDGPAASGKGTLARRLATHLDYAYLDTGRLYRAVALSVLRGGGDPADPLAAVGAARKIDSTLLDDPALGADEIGQAASVVAASPDVRNALFDVQKQFARQPPGGKDGAVLDGRDIGTVVCPEAPVKLYLTGSADERARRRFEELRGRGDGRIYARVLAEIEERDRRDSTRSVAPLMPAPDAIVIDTTGMTIDAVFAEALAHVTAGAGTDARS